VLLFVFDRELLVADRLPVGAQIITGSPTVTVSGAVVNWSSSVIVSAGCGVCWLTM
jgi:hypothetical protein